MSADRLIIRPGEDFQLPEKSPYRHEAPLMPMVVQEGPRGGGLPVPDDEREALLDFARWIMHPHFAKEGRSAFVARKRPLEVDGATVAAYKLKGVGSYDLNEQVVKPPSNDTFQHSLHRGRPASADDWIQSMLPTIIIHVGVAEDGTFVPVLDPPKPMGGLAPGRGQREFEIAARLHQAGVPACTPITWGRYPNIGWQGQGPIEFVILGQPTASAERIGDYFEPDISQGRYELSELFKRAIATRIDVTDERGMGEAALKLTNEMARLEGGLLRKAHEAGVARFAGHTGNFTYQPGKRTAFMHDFDSSIFLKSLYPRARGITMVRDLESALFGLMHSLAHSELFWIVANEDRFRSKNPARAMVNGYFHESAGQGDERRQATDAIADELVRLIKVRGRNPSVMAQSQWLQDSSSSFTLFLTCHLFRIYPRSDLAQSNPLPYGVDEIGVYWKRFERARMGMFEDRVRTLRAKLPDWLRGQVEPGIR